MKTFVQYIEEQVRPPIKASGIESERHEKQYVTPYIGSDTPTHRMAKDHGAIKSGSEVKLHKAERHDGVLHLHVSDSAGSKEVVPASKIEKPGAKPSNKGFDYEAHVIDKIKSHGLMDKSATGAGFTSGNDFHLIDKRKQTKHKGEVHTSESALQGEAKSGKTAAFGQLTIAHSHEKGWHIPDHSRENRPEYAKHIDKIKVDGKSLFDHMNEKHHPGGLTPGGQKAKNIVVHHPDMEPAKAYLADHHVDVVQVGKHGLYHTGKDKTGHGLPELKGEGQFRIRQKTADPNKRTVQFMAKKLDKSHVSLDNDDHVASLAKTLGHK